MSWECLNRDDVSKVETSVALRRLEERKCPWKQDLRTYRKTALDLDL